jgi:integrase/recombinase XerD
LPFEEQPVAADQKKKGIPGEFYVLRLKQLAAQAGLQRVPVSAHTLRHTFALHYLRQHPSKLRELADLLGHESLDTTAVYTKPSRDDVAADLERSPLNVFDL